MFEEMIFILQGRGATSVWVEGSPKHVFEWQEGSLFAAPLNIWHELHNGQGDQPARFLAVTSAPLVMNLYHNFDFIFNNSFIFEDRYQPVADYFSPKGKLVQGLISRVWESNFIPDVNQFKLPIARSAVAGERGSRLSFLKTPWQLIPRVLLWTSTKKLIVMDPARTF